MREKNEAVEKFIKDRALTPDVAELIRCLAEQKEDAKYQSNEIHLLAGALAKAQGAYKKLVPNQTYKGTKYANLEAILEATREPLSINGLSFNQRDVILNDGSGIIITKSIVMHESGQWISSWARIVPEKTLKETMNTYETISRLHASKLLGIAPSITDPYLFDDNGEYQSERQLIEDLQKPQEELLKERTSSRKVIDDRQYRSLMAEIGADRSIAQEIMDKQAIGALEYLPEDAYLKTLAWIRRVKSEAKNELERKRR